jgi:hypothetical protein
LSYDALSNLIFIVAKESMVKVLETKNPMDVIGIELKEDDTKKFLTIYSYPPKGNRSRCCNNIINNNNTKTNGSLKNVYRCKRHYKLTVLPSTSSPITMNDDLTSVLQGVRAVAHLPAVSRCRKVLLIMNTHAGTGKAQHIYDTVVKPMWEQAGLHHDACLTTGAGYAKDLVSSHDDLVSTYEAIVTMGSDGILYEVMQGINQRSDSTPYSCY